MRCLFLGISLLVLVAPNLSEAVATPTLSLDLGNGSQLEAVWIPKGEFLQGSPASESGRGADEAQRRVILTKDFYLAKYPVTVGQFSQFVRETGYRTEAERGSSGGFGLEGSGLVQRKQFNWRNPGFPQSDLHPVTLVTYDDAQAFVRWLAKKSHREVWLPTEAQWEYACRAGTTTAHYAGPTADDLQEAAWYRTNAGAGTKPVGQKKANPFGLYDMSGNVYQWCRDWYGPYEGIDAGGPGATGTLKDPEETRSNRSTPARRVLRGGSWLKDAPACRSAARYRNTPGSRNADNGFRVAVSAALIVEQSQSKLGSPAQSAAGPTASIRSQQTGGDSHSATSGEAIASGDFQGANASPPAAAAAGNTPQGIPRDAMPNGIVASSSPGALMMTGLLCPLFFAVVLVIAAALVFKSVFSQQQTRDSGRGPRALRDLREPEVGEDGFWLDTSNIPPGSQVRYRYRMQGREFHDTVRTRPGARQYIYTGGVPTDILILDKILLAEDALHRPESEPIVAETIENDVPPAPSKFHGYPTAY